ncbi:hypothetical protein P154DRAFT_527304 [Amniculicola lignicola CBS 123094]|uniref:Membrane-associated proteins in eicosanoid and glutathione metabolism n=1 Tax=Amniculicola lignicola CBS 123094 TaxID=1392246 RepID=A0A6A5VWY7_9PLEO|nr:hypothetical protein P154DRAFT_527304 [Amniculicola lignicola CBS 123094]
MKAKLRERIDVDTYALYERAEACHANGMENLPVFATAVILGNMAGLKKEGLGGMTGFASLFLGLRVLYTVAYLTTTTRAPTLLRSGLWFTGTILCFRTIVKAAKSLGGSS